LTQDNAPNKPVHLIFICGALLFFVLLQWTTDWVWGYFTRTPSEFLVTMFAGVATLILGVSMYRNERVFTLVSEVSGELKKVSWPTGKEVRAATIVVVVMTIISAIILGLFDLLWSNVTRLIYGA
jgi:preprotein translocase subunit SecE